MKVTEEEMSLTGIEEYYQYIIEQLEFVEMITSCFDVKQNMLTKKTTNRCRELADKIKTNVAHI